MKPHRICLLIYPGVACYDVAGPLQALAAAGNGLYSVTLVSPSGGPIESDCLGLSLGSVDITNAPSTIDTLILPGGRDATAGDAALVRSVEHLAARSERIACIRGGAFLAAEAGLLEERRAAIHRRHHEKSAHRFGDTNLERHPIWLQDGKVWSSCGSGTGLDLALTLIEKDHGDLVAMQVARELGVPCSRPDDPLQPADIGARLESLFAWIAHNLAADLRAEVLAERVGMSLRTFARVCVKRTGLPPAKIVERIRVEAARKVIEQSDAPLGAIAARYGFGDAQRMRRAFLRHARATPSDIRAQSRRSAV